MYDLLEIVRQHHVSMKNEISIVIATTFVLEGWATRMDPDLQIIEIIGANTTRQNALVASLYELAQTERVFRTATHTHTFHRSPLAAWGRTGYVVQHAQDHEVRAALSVPTASRARARGARSPLVVDDGERGELFVVR